MDWNGHYRVLLGLDSSWRVAGVDLALEDQRVEIAVEWAGGKEASCPECGEGGAWAFCFRCRCRCRNRQTVTGLLGPQGLVYRLVRSQILL